MEIMITDSALKWFKEEVKVKQGDKVKFYTQIYGTSPLQPGISLAFTKDHTPINAVVQKEVDGIEFYIEESDLWFFKGHNLQLNYNEKTDEIEFSYIEPNN